MHRLYLRPKEAEKTMARIIPVMAVFLLLVGCDHKPGPTAAKAQKDPKIAAIEERVAKTTPEGKQIIEKVLAMKPEVNEQVSTKTLGELLTITRRTRALTTLLRLDGKPARKNCSRLKRRDAGR
jgi:hypothetical protein